MRIGNNFSLDLAYYKSIPVELHFSNLNLDLPLANGLVGQSALPELKENESLIF